MASRARERAVRTTIFMSVVVGERVAWWTRGSNGLTLSKIHNRRVAQAYGWNRTSCGREVGELVHGVNEAIVYAEERCKICERIENKYGQKRKDRTTQPVAEEQQGRRDARRHLAADSTVPESRTYGVPDPRARGRRGIVPTSPEPVPQNRTRRKEGIMSSKARRNRQRLSGDPKEVEVRTGVKPAPGTVISRKTRDIVAENRARAKMKAAAASEALAGEDYTAAGRLFKEASDAANLANAHKMRLLKNAGRSR